MDENEFKEMVGLLRANTMTTETFRTLVAKHEGIVKPKTAIARILPIQSWFANELYSTVLIGADGKAYPVSNSMAVFDSAPPSSNKSYTIRASLKMVKDFERLINIRYLPLASAMNGVVKLLDGKSGKKKHGGESYEVHAEAIKKINKREYKYLLGQGGTTFEKLGKVICESHGAKIWMHDEPTLITGKLFVKESSRETMGFLNEVISSGHEGDITATQSIMNGVTATIYPVKITFHACSQNERFAQFISEGGSDMRVSGFLSRFIVFEDNDTRPNEARFSGESTEVWGSMRRAMETYFTKYLDTEFKEYVRVRKEYISDKLVEISNIIAPSDEVFPDIDGKLCDIVSEFEWHKAPTKVMSIIDTPESLYGKLKVELVNQSNKQSSIAIRYVAPKYIENFTAYCLAYQMLDNVMSDKYEDCIVSDECIKAAFSLISRYVFVSNDIIDIAESSNEVADILSELPLNLNGDGEFSSLSQLRLKSKKYGYRRVVKGSLTVDRLWTKALCSAIARGFIEITIVGKSSQKGEVLSEGAAISHISKGGQYALRMTTKGSHFAAENSCYLMGKQDGRSE